MTSHPCGWMPWCIKPDASALADEDRDRRESGPVWPLLARIPDLDLQAALKRLWRRI